MLFGKDAADIAELQVAAVLFQLCRYNALDRKDCVGRGVAGIGLRSARSVLRRHWVPNEEEEPPLLQQCMQRVGIDPGARRSYTRSTCTVEPNHV